MTTRICRVDSAYAGRLRRLPPVRIPVTRNLLSPQPVTRNPSSPQLGASNSAAAPSPTKQLPPVPAHSSDSGGGGGGGGGGETGRTRDGRGGYSPPAISQSRTDSSGDQSTASRLLARQTGPGRYGAGAGPGAGSRAAVTRRRLK